MKNPRRLVAHYKASNFSNKIVISFSRFNEDNDYCYEEVYDTNGNLICQKNKAGEVNLGINMMRMEILFAPMILRSKFGMIQEVILLIH